MVRDVACLPSIEIVHAQTEYLQYWREGRQVIYKLLGTLFLLSMQVDDSVLILVQTFPPFQMANDLSIDPYNSRFVETKQA